MQDVNFNTSSGYTAAGDVRRSVRLCVYQLTPILFYSSRVKTRVMITMRSSTSCAGEGAQLAQLMSCTPVCFISLFDLLHLFVSPHSLEYDAEPAWTGSSKKLAYNNDTYVTGPSAVAEGAEGMEGSVALSVGFDLPQDSKSVAFAIAASQQPQKKGKEGAEGRQQRRALPPGFGDITPTISVEVGAQVLN